MGLRTTTVTATRLLGSARSSASSPGGEMAVHERRP